MSLNDSKIRKLKPSSRPVKLSDSHGLYLLVNPGGSRIWYLKYRFNGKESRVSLGAYPLVSLAEARQQRDGIRKLLAQNINPAQQRMAEKAACSSEKCFKAVALAWHKTNKKWSADYAARFLRQRFHFTAYLLMTPPATKTNSLRRVLFGCARTIPSRRSGWLLRFREFQAVRGTDRLTKQGCLRASCPPRYRSFSSLL